MAEFRIVWDEHIALQDALHQRMPPVADADAAVRAHGRADIAIGCGRRRKALQDIDARNRTGDALNRHELLAYALAQLCEEMILKGGDLLLCAENLRLEVLQLLRDETLRIRERLLADIALGHLIAPTVAHLDVVAEHLVVADLERLDARARAFTFLHLLQEGLAVMGKTAEFIEIGMIARTDHAALAHREPRLIHERTRELVTQRIEGLDLPCCTHKETARCRCETRAHGGQGGEGDAQGDEVACVRRLRLNACQEPLEVIDRMQGIAQVSAQRTLFHQLCHRIQPRINAVRREQRMFEPRFQEARSHRCARKVEHVKEGVLFPAVAQTARDL